MKPARGAILQVLLGLFASQPMKQLPRRVAKPEERPSIRGHEEMPVLGYAESRQRERTLCIDDRSSDAEREGDDDRMLQDQ